MKSGDENESYEKEYYREEFAKISDVTFQSTVFKPIPSLRTINPGPSGKISTPYEGQAYDPEEWEVIPDLWDHEHCEVCWFSIQESYSYWVNTSEQILCDMCYSQFSLYLQKESDR